jgi:hypothetical protein
MLTAYAGCGSVATRAFRKNVFPKATACPAELNGPATPLRRLAKTMRPTRFSASRERRPPSRMGVRCRCRAIDPMEGGGPPPPCLRGTCIAEATPR